MSQPLDRSTRLPQLGDLDKETGEFWREHTFEMGEGKDNLSAYEPNRMYLNLDGKRFLDCSFASGCDIDADSRSVAAADFDRDGAPDLLVGSVGGGPLRLFANRFSDDHRSVRLHLVGTKSNRAGIGSRATLTIGNRKIVRDLFPANGCLGQAPAELLVGVGKAKHIDSLEIRWPTGTTQHFLDLPVNGVLTLTEGQDGFEISPHRPVSSKSPRPSAFVSIDSPVMQSVDETKLAVEEPVLGLSYKSSQRAYPIRYLRYHAICNDTVEGDAVLISYCSPAATYGAFERRVVSAGRDSDLTLNFDVAGMLGSVGYTVLQDRETKSLWNPLTGQCIQGKLSGTWLKRVPIFSTDWKHWRALNESTTVLAPVRTSYPNIPTDGSESGSKFVQGVRTNCEPDDMGLGIRGASQQLFLPLNQLASFKGRFVSGRLDDRKIVVFIDQEQSNCHCFYAELPEDGSEIVFSQDDSSAERFTSRDGSTFDMLGRCVSGPQEGAVLVQVANSSLVRWYAWSLTFPKTFVIKSRE